MRKLTSVIVILGLVVAAKLLIKNEDYNPEEASRRAISMNRPADNDCLPIDEYMYKNPDATADELYQTEQCSKARAVRLGLDKPNTGFLGNTRSPPEGALAHYEQSGGRNFFTVYDDHIVANASEGPDGDTEILFSRVSEIGRGRQFPSSVRIEYTTESGSKKAYAFMLMRDDDSLKAEGATDLDRLIALLEKQKNKYRKQEF